MASALKLIEDFRELKSVDSSEDSGSSDLPLPNAVFNAARSGSELELLMATRDRVAQAIDDPSTPARDLAALTKRIVDITGQIKVCLEGAEEVSDDAEEQGDADFDPSTV